MKTSSLRRVMQLVLAAAATDAAVACGGALTSSTEGDPSGSATGVPGTEENQSEPEREPPQNRRKPDVPPDAGQKDANVKDVVTTDTTNTQSCINGTTAPHPELCCKTAGDPNCMSSGGGNQCTLDCNAVCAQVAPGAPTGFRQCNWTTSQAGDWQINYLCGACGVGRIPGGTGSCPRGDSIAERLAMQAYYEAASVIAFCRLAEVLVAEGAPPSLVARVGRAAGDEERHALVFTRLATARGATVRTPTVDRPLPTLLELARENAQEGCVRETFGALVALHQAQHAEDAELRAAFASIADDEVEHAALSWELATWFETRLGREVDAARVEAVIVLREAATRDHDAVDRALGMPPVEAARAMFDDLFARIAA